MTDVQLPTIIQAISEVTISGVTITDADSIPENALDYCPIMYPEPEEPIRNVEYTALTFPAHGHSMKLEYTLRYRFLYAPIGSGSALANQIGILNKISLILEAILPLYNPTGAAHMKFEGVAIGNAPDLTGQNIYHGADIYLRVTEFVN